MGRRILLGCLLLILLAPRVALAKSKPIEQLPKDLLRWSFCWTAIPQQMAEVSRDDGALAGMTWGPTKGTAVMVESTTRELWDAAKPDGRPAGRRKSDVRGVLFRYDF